MTCEGRNGPDIPTLEPRNHCLLHRRKVVRPLAEIRDLERPNGPPSGGIPTGILSLILSFQMNRSHHQSAVPYLYDSRAY